MLKEYDVEFSSVVNILNKGKQRKDPNMSNEKGSGLDRISFKHRLKHVGFVFGVHLNIKHTQTQG